MESLPGLSEAAKRLIAKTSQKNSAMWLPLSVHLTDTAETARRLWNLWLPEGSRRVIAAGLSDSGMAEQLIVFLAAVHDVGKATPLFLARCLAAMARDAARTVEGAVSAAGLTARPLSAFPYQGKTPHAAAGEALLEAAGCNPGAAVIVGAHHGKPPEEPPAHLIRAYGANFHLGKEAKGAWRNVQEEFIGFALSYAGFSSLNDVPVPNLQAQVLLSGLLIMADWIASNEAYFPYIPIEDAAPAESAEARAGRAWEALSLPSPWDADNRWMDQDLYRERFGFSANGMQRIVAGTAADMPSPGILVLEAPMGQGKTEAALAAAEILANRFGCSGVFFALPTQATSNGMFQRMLDWANRQADGSRQSIVLAHAMAELNEAYRDLFHGSAAVFEDGGGAFVHEWFTGRKKTLLANFVVGTIDQLLLAALKQKHVMLRHLGLAGKVVIIDECHAYDAYMGQYLRMALRWLGSYHVPVVVLSATLPAATRTALIDAYRFPEREAAVPPTAELWRTRASYPLLTWSCGNGVLQSEIPPDGRSRSVAILRLPVQSLAAKLAELLPEGGCAGVIVNTVRRAQALARELRAVFGEDAAGLFHSRLLMPDRIAGEAGLLQRLDKPAPERTRPFRWIAVGTQVMEQSLDYDVDVLFTELCPMDLLLQRIGRLQRHARTRPPRLRDAQCFVLTEPDGGFDAGSKAVYGAYLLLRTNAFLPERIRLPDDISPLVQAVYDETVPMPAVPPGYERAHADWALRIAKKEIAARAFRITPPRPEELLYGWLSTDIPVFDQKAEAAVRDTDPSIEVIVLQSRGNAVAFLPWTEGGRVIPADRPPSEEDARRIAMQRLRLPAAFCYSPEQTERTILTLEETTRARVPAWQDCGMLRGELFLLLDEALSVNISGYRAVYDQRYGLQYEKEGSNDA